MFEFEVDDNRLCITLADDAFRSQVSYYYEDGDFCKEQLICDIATIDEFFAFNKKYGVGHANHYWLSFESVSDDGFLYLAYNAPGNFAGKFSTSCFEIGFYPTRKDLLELKKALKSYLKKYF